MSEISLMTKFEFVEPGPIFLFGFDCGGAMPLTMKAGAHAQIAVPFSRIGMWCRYGAAVTPVHDGRSEFDRSNGRKKFVTRYFKFLKQNGLNSYTAKILFPLHHRVNNFIHLRSLSNFRLIYYFEQVISSLAWLEYSLPLSHGKLNGSFSCFCISKVGGEYKRVPGKYCLRVAGDKVLG